MSASNQTSELGVVTVLLQLSPTAVAGNTIDVRAAVGEEASDTQVITVAPANQVGGGDVPPGVTPEVDIVADALSFTLGNDDQIPLQVVGAQSGRWATSGCGCLLRVVDGPGS